MSRVEISLYGSNQRQMEQSENNTFPLGESLFICINYYSHCLDIKILHRDFLQTFKYWVGVQQGRPYLTGRRCVISLVGQASGDGVTIKKCLME